MTLNVESASGSQALMIAFADRCLRDREPFVAVDVRELVGSAPRKQGTVMLVSKAGFSGSIGGGHLEHKAIERCRQLLKHADADQVCAPAEFQTYNLGPSLGQCCGGRVVLAFTRITTLNGSETRTKILAMEPKRFHLNLFGAGHVGRALVQSLALLPCSVRWIDERADEFEQFGPISDAPNIEICCVDSPEAEVSAAKQGDFYLVTTHSHDLDLLLIAAILRRGDAGYVGLIGSATKRASFESRLQARGLATEHLVCPVGLAGIDGKEPEVIALAVAAQLMQLSAKRR